MSNLINRTNLHRHHKEINDENNKIKTIIEKIQTHIFSYSYILEERFSNYLSNLFPKPLKIAISLGISLYDISMKVHRLFIDSEKLTTGLTEESSDALYEELSNYFNQCLSIMIPETINDNAYFGKLKKSFITKIINSSLKCIPSDYLSKITVKQIRKLFTEGQLTILKEIIIENGLNFSTEKIEKILIDMISSNIVGMSTDFMSLLTKFSIINESPSDFYIESTKNDDNSYTIEIYTNSLSRIRTTLDLSQKATEIIIFEKISLEEYQNLTVFLEKIQNKSTGHSNYTGTEFPDVISLFLKKPYTIKVASTIQNGLFSENCFLNRLREKIATTVFDGDPIETDESLIHLLILESLICFYQREHEFNSIEIIEISNHITQIEQIINATPNYKRKKIDLKIIEDFKTDIKEILKKTVLEQIEPNKSKDLKLVIPEIIWSMIDEIFKFANLNTVLFDKICLGLESTFGSEFGNLIQAAKKEYLSRTPLIDKFIDYDKISFIEYGYSLIVVFFLNYALFELINLSMGLLFPFSMTLRMIIGGITGLTINEIALNYIVTDKMNKIYKDAIDHILFNAVPQLVELIFYFFISDKIKEELAYQIKLFDAFTFKANFQLQEKKLIDAVFIPNEPIFETAKSLRSRLNQSRIKFIEDVKKEEEKSRIISKGSVLYSDLFKIAKSSGSIIEEKVEEEVISANLSFTVENKLCSIIYEDFLNFIEQNLIQRTQLSGKESEIKFLSAWDTKKFSSISFVCNFRFNSNLSVKETIPDKLTIILNADSGDNSGNIGISLDPASTLFKLSDCDYKNLIKYMNAFSSDSDDSKVILTLLKYKKYATQYPSDKPPCAILTRNEINSISDEALHQHLEFWIALLKSPITDSINLEKKLLILTLIQEKISTDFIKRRIKLTLVQPKFNSFLQNTIESLIPKITDSIPPLRFNFFHERPIHRPAREELEIRTDAVITKAKVVSPIFIEYITHLAEFDPIVNLPILDEPIPRKKVESSFSVLFKFLTESLPSLSKEEHETVFSELELEVMPDEVLYFFEESELEIKTEPEYDDASEFSNLKIKSFNHPLANQVSFNHTEQIEIYKRIIALERAYPSCKIETPDDIFLYFKQVEKAYKKQMRLYIILTSYEKSSKEIVFICRKIIQKHLEKAILSLNIFHETIDHPFFSERQWLQIHTNKLARMLHKFSLMQETLSYEKLQKSYSNRKDLLRPTPAYSSAVSDTFKTALWKSSTLFLIEDLIQREVPEYIPANFYYPYLRIAKSLTTGNESEFENLLFENLAKIRIKQVIKCERKIGPDFIESFKLLCRDRSSQQLLDRYTHTNPSELTQIRFNRKTIFPMIVHDLLRMMKWNSKYNSLRSANLFFNHNITTHYDELLHCSEIFFTESILENLVFESELLKKDFKASSANIISLFHDFIFQDLFRFEQQIKHDKDLVIRLVKNLLEQKINGRFESSILIDIKRILAFLIECLEKHHPDFRKSLSKIEIEFLSILIKERIEIKVLYFHSDDLHTRKIHDFLIPFNPSDVRLWDRLLMEQFCDRYLENELLRTDEEFLKQVVLFINSMSPSHSEIDIENFSLLECKSSKIIFKSKKLKLLLNLSEEFSLTVTEVENEDSDSEILLRKFTDASDIKAYISDQSGIKKIIIKRNNHTLNIIDDPQIFQLYDFSQAVLFPTYPYIKFLSQETVTPELLQRFLWNNKVTIFDTLNSIKQIYLEDSKEEVVFEVSEDQVNCSLIPRSKLSPIQNSPDNELLGNYLIFENGIKKIALAKKNPYFFFASISIFSNLSSYLQNNLKQLLRVVPGLDNLIYQINPYEIDQGIEVIPLDSNGYIEPVTTDDYARVLFGTYSLDKERFNKTLSEFLMKIELKEPLQGNLSVSSIIAVIGIFQNLANDIIHTRIILETIWIYLQSIELHSSPIPIKEKTLIFILSIPIYLKYINNNIDEIDPIPLESEAIFLHELYTLLEETIINESSFGEHILLTLESICQGILFPLIFHFTSEKFFERMKFLDENYSAEGFSSLSYKLSKISRTLIQHTRYTRSLSSRMSLQFQLGQFFVKSIGIKLINFIPNRKLQITDLKESNDQDFILKKLIEQNYDDKLLKSSFINIIKELFNINPEKEILNKPLREKIIKFLASALLPETTPRQALRFLQFIYFKLSERNEPIPLEDMNREFLENALNEFHAIRSTHVTESLFEWSKREISAITCHYKAPALTWKVYHSLCSYVLPDYTPFMRNLAIGLDATDSITCLIYGEKKRKLREMSCKYSIHQNVVEDYNYFENFFEELTTKYFNILHIESPTDNRLPKLSTKDDKFASYFNDRVIDSYISLTTTISKKRLFSLKTTFERYDLKHEIQNIHAILTEQSKLLNDEIISLFRKTSSRCPTLQDLYKIALESDPVLKLEECYGIRKSLAELAISRIMQLALYMTYQLKSERILNCIDLELSDDEIGRTLFEKKHYTISQQENTKIIQGYLIFEATNRLWLRELQTRQMNIALERHNDSCLIEMIPGSGKTAFSILMDLYYHHEKGKASIGIFSKSLITSTKKTLAERYYRFTGKRAFLMEIDRVKSKKTTLSHLLQRFQASQENGDIIITTKEDIQALELLYIENLYLRKRKKLSNISTIRTLKKILCILKNSSSIVDECHQILSPQDIEKYPFSEERRLSKQEISGHELVFQTLMEFCSKIDCAMIEVIQNKELYSEFKTLVIKSLLKHFSEELSSERLEELEVYLLNLEETPPSWLESSSKSNFIAMVRGIICELLPNCSQDKVHTTYGLSKVNLAQKFVIPYSANNSPIEGSIFESPHETFLKSYLYYIQSIDSIDNNELKMAIKTQINFEAELNDVDPSETETADLLYKYFNQTDPNLIDFSMNPTIKIIFYLRLVIAPTILYYQDSIESSSSNFISILGQTNFYSGTIYNKSLYDQGLKKLLIKETTAQTLDIVDQRLKESGEIIILDKISSVEDFLIRIESNSAYMMAIDSGALFNGFSNETVAMMIAKRFRLNRKEIQGIIFFDENNNQKFLMIDGHSVIDYNPDLIDKSARFTYLDQSHSFGVDIPQKKEAKALITVGRNTLGDIEQACWRLRGLESLNQTACFAILPECPNQLALYGLTIKSFEDMIIYLSRIEFEKLKSQSLQATFQKIHALIRYFLMEKIFSGTDELCNEILDKFEGFFIHHKIINPFLRYGLSKTFIEVNLVIENFKKQNIDQLIRSELFSEEELSKLILVLDEVKLPILPEITRVSNEGTLSFNGTYCQQKQLVKDEVKEKEMHKVTLEIPNEPTIISENESLIPWKKIDTLDPNQLFASTPSEISSRKDAIPIMSIIEIFSKVSNPIFKTFSRFLKPEMIITHNVIQFSKLDRSTIFKESLLLFYSPLELTWNCQVSDLLIIQNKSDMSMQVIGLGIPDSVVWEKKLLKESETSNHRFAIIKLNTGSCYNLSSVHPSLLSFSKSQDFQDTLLRFKIFNGSIHYTFSERQRLAAMVSDLLKEGFSEDELLQATDEIYKIRQRNNLRNLKIQKRNPLSVIIANLADPQKIEIL